MGDYYPRVLSASTLIGDTVVNAGGEKLGAIKDIVIDLYSGHIAYAVLSFGVFLGLGDKLFALPWEALVLDTEAKRFVLSVDKEFLKNAPGFDKSNWPEAPSREFITEMYGYHGYEPRAHEPRTR